MTVVPNAVAVKPLVGEAARDGLRALAALRIAVFREWPYLYDGDEAYEARYLADFAAAPQALIAGAFSGARMVGAATAAPLASQDEGVRAPFQAAGFDVGEVFYFGESVLEPRFRGQGVGHRFFDAREAHARAQGARFASFCAVVRRPDDPRKPAQARDLAPFWRARGYSPLHGAFCHIGWKEVGATEETDHALQVWSRAL